MYKTKSAWFEYSNSHTQDDKSSKIIRFMQCWIHEKAYLINGMWWRFAQHLRVLTSDDTEVLSNNMNKYYRNTVIQIVRG